MMAGLTRNPVTILPPYASRQMLIPVFYRQCYSRMSNEKTCSSMLLFFLAPALWWIYLCEEDGGESCETGDGH